MSKTEQRRPAVKRFPMPKGSPVPTVTIREICGADESEAAAMVDALGDPTLDGIGVIRAERKEAIRRSVVALGDIAVTPDVPLFQIDKWSRVPTKALEQFFSVINGLRQSEVNEAVEAAESIWDDATHRAGKRYKMPERCSFDTVTIWEIGGNEEVSAALRVDRMPDAGPALTVLRQRRELIRGSLRDAGVDLDFEALNLRTATALALFFDDVNGIPEEEISGCVAAAVDLSGAAPAESVQPQNGGGVVTG